MARGDVIVYDEGTKLPGAKRFKVHTDPGVTAAAPGINAGELVLVSLGNTAGKYVTKWGASVTTKPAVGSHYIAGLATSDSTNTATADGIVDVLPVVSGMTFLIAAGTPATYGVGSTPVQATYDALVGARVLISTSSTGVMTLLATDYGGNTTNGLGNGCVVEPLDVFKYPGKVRFSIKQRCMYSN